MNQRAGFAFLFFVAVTYWQDIAPILNSHCIECHARGASLNLSRFPFLSKFTEDQPTIVARIIEKTGAAAPSMPPGNRPKLTAAQIDVLTQWQEQGLDP